MCTQAPHHTHPAAVARMTIGSVGQSATTRVRFPAAACELRVLLLQHLLLLPLTVLLLLLLLLQLLLLQLLLLQLLLL